MARSSAVREKGLAAPAIIATRQIAIVQKTRYNRRLRHIPGENEKTQEKAEPSGEASVSSVACEGISFTSITVRIP